MSKGVYEDRGRQRKMNAFVCAFDEQISLAGNNPFSREACEAAIAQLTSATDAQWEATADRIHRHVPSKGGSRDLIIATYRARIAPHDKDADCTLMSDGTCFICGRHHGAACTSCGGRGFHAGACAAERDAFNARLDERMRMADLGRCEEA